MTFNLLVTCTFSKWTVAEIDLLHSAVKSFGNDLNKIAEKMKSRTVYVLICLFYRSMRYLQWSCNKSLLLTLIYLNKTNPNFITIVTTTIWATFASIDNQFLVYLLTTYWLNCCESIIVNLTDTVQATLLLWDIRVYCMYMKPTIEIEHRHRHNECRLLLLVHSTLC